MNAAHSIAPFTVTYPNGSTRFVFSESVALPTFLEAKQDIILLVDQNILALYSANFKAYPVIKVPANEDEKSFETILDLSQQLLKLKTNRNSFLVGIGGGLCCDMVGFLASIYMRGISFALIPTSLLAMCDAAIGGKNGINISTAKNILGCMQQPEFISIQTGYLNSLAATEWSNAFAEIIKYAAIMDSALWQQLKENTLDNFMQNNALCTTVIAKCIQHKNSIVLQDPTEKHERKKLNFGHTLGHAFERNYALAHGQAVALGMIVACILSEKHSQLNPSIQQELCLLLKRYKLPTHLNFDLNQVITLLEKDKKRKDAVHLDFILLDQVGKASIKSLTFQDIIEGLQIFKDACNY